MKFFVVLLFALFAYQMVAAVPHRESRTRVKRSVEWFKKAWATLKSAFEKAVKLVTKVQDKSEKYMNNIKTAYNTAKDGFNKALKYSSDKIKELKKLTDNASVQNILGSVEKAVDGMITSMEQAQLNAAQLEAKSMAENTAKMEGRLNDAEKASIVEEQNVNKTLMEAVTDKISNAIACTDVYAPKAQKLHSTQMEQLKNCTGDSFEKAKSLWNDLKKVYNESREFYAKVKQEYGLCKNESKSTASCLFDCTTKNYEKFYELAQAAGSHLARINEDFFNNGKKVYNCCKTSVDSGKAEWTALFGQVKECLGYKNVSVK